MKDQKIWIIKCHLATEYNKNNWYVALWVQGKPIYQIKEWHLKTVMKPTEAYMTTKPEAIQFAMFCNSERKGYYYEVVLYAKERLLYNFDSSY